MTRTKLADISSVCGANASRDERMQCLIDAVWQAWADQHVSWVGFYVDQPHEPDDRRLVLGPHRDKPACSPIGLHGVCGQALVSCRTQIVADVLELGDGYVACDPRDRSELVIPCFDADGTCWGVLDLDSFDIGAFSIEDATSLTRFLEHSGLTVSMDV